MNKLEILREIIEKYRDKDGGTLYLDDDRELCYTEYCDTCDAYILKGILAKLPYDEYDEDEIYEVIDEACDDDFVKKYSYLDICTCDCEE